MMRPLAAATVLIALLLGSVRPGIAQARPERPLDRASRPAASAPDLLRTPGGAFTASLLVPGAGQAALGLRRWLAYVALEVTGWAVHLDAASERRSTRQAYRDLAWREARLQVEPRQDGSWGYYETLSHYERSGAYDIDASAPGLQPETDPGTYNGSVWGLARSIFLPGGQGGPGSEEHGRALEYYEAHAAGPGFLWSWEDAPEAQERFRALIGRADDAARIATGALGAVLANHLIAAVDAFAIARIRSDRRIRLEGGIAPTDPIRWRVGLSISL